VLKVVALQICFPLVALSPLLFAGNHLASTKKGSPTDGIAIRVSVDLVMLPVTVTDRNGRSIAGLKQGNFRIFDNGMEQAIHYFSTGDVPISMGLVLDRSGSMAEMKDEVYKAAFHNVGASSPQDEFFIMTFDEETELWQNFSTDRELLRKRLKKIKVKGGTALYDAISTGLTHIRQAKHDKKVLLVVTDGDDNKSQTTFPELLERLRQENVALYAIALWDKDTPFAPGHDLESLAARLIQLGEVSGGRAYFPRSKRECEQTSLAIAEELHLQYGLGYYPNPRPRGGDWHSVHIQLQLPEEQSKNGLAARARAGYFAPQH